MMPEPAFRIALTELTLALEDRLPSALYATLVDHLSRSDGQGGTLCFDGPQRAQVMTLLTAWAHAESPALVPQLQALYAQQPDAWPGPLHFPPVHHAPKPVMIDRPVPKAVRRRTPTRQDLHQPTLFRIEEHTP